MALRRTLPGGVQVSIYHLPDGVEVELRESPGGTVGLRLTDVAQLLVIIRASCAEEWQAVSGGSVSESEPAKPLFAGLFRGEPAPRSPVLTKGGGDHGTDGPYCRVCHVVHVAPHTYYRDCLPCARCAPPEVNKGGGAGHSHCACTGLYRGVFEFAESCICGHHVSHHNDGGPARVCALSCNRCLECLEAADRERRR